MITEGTESPLMIFSGDCNSVRLIYLKNIIFKVQLIFKPDGNVIARLEEYCRQCQYVVIGQLTNFENYLFQNLVVIEIWRLGKTR